MLKKHHKHAFGPSEIYMGVMKIFFKFYDFGRGLYEIHVLDEYFTSPVAKSWIILKTAHLQYGLLDTTLTILFLLSLVNVQLWFFAISFNIYYSDEILVSALLVSQTKILISTSIKFRYHFCHQLPSQ